MYSQAWVEYAFMTHALRDLISHDRSYRWALQAKAGGLPSGGFESVRNDPSVAQVPLHGPPPCGPSRLRSGDQTSPLSDAEGSPSRPRLVSAGVGIGHKVFLFVLL